MIMANTTCSMCCGTGKFNDFEIDPITKAVVDFIITCPSCMGTGKAGGSSQSSSSTTSGNNQSDTNTNGQIPR